MSRASAEPTDRAQVNVDSGNSTRHRCYLCDRTYERQDHLSRHLRSHDNERLYRCPECGKGFNRADLLNRHRAAHARSSDENYRRRIGHACEACVKAKTRCNDDRPCKRCKSRDIPCQSTSDRREPSLHAASIDNSRRDFGPDVQRSDSLQTQEQASIAEPNRQLTPAHNGSIIEDTAQLLETNFTASATSLINGLHGVHDPMCSRDAAVGGLDVSIDHFDHMMMPGFNTTSMDGGTQIPFDFLNFTQEMDQDFFNLDLSFLADGLARPVSAEDRYSPQHNPHGSINDSNTPHAQRQTEAFKRSPWSGHEWFPSRGVRPFHGQDEQAINMRDDGVDAVDHLTRPGYALSTRCNMGQEARDRMIRVATQVSGDRLSMPSFPSLKLLKDLIDIMLSQDSCSVNSFVHAPSLEWATTRTETLLGMVAAGTRYVALEPVWKMGLIFQEVTRLATGCLFESDNSTTRDLQALQASILWLEIGTWSGFRRKTEIASSLLHSVITMLAWANRYSKTCYSPIVPLPQDDDKQLRGKWKPWIEQESFKRMIIHAFIHDSQEATIHMHNPLMSVAQMLLPFPAAKELWLAPTAEAWRDLYLKSPTAATAAEPSLVSVLGDTSILNTTAGIDEPLCLLFACHALAHEVWQYRQQTQILVECQIDGRSNRWFAHKISQKSLHDDLIRLYAYCELYHSDLTEVLYTLNFLLMCLYVTLEDIQTFCSTSGDDEAQKVFHRIREWTESADSRTAVWYAGQVFRLARMFEVTRLRDFYAVVLYHSALTLWVYGWVTTDVARRSHPRTSLATVGTQASLDGGTLTSQNVIVNGDDERSMRAFTLLGQRHPCLENAASGVVPISDGKGVITTAEDLFKSNFPQCRDGLPPLIENLGNLMSELGRLSGT